MHQRRRQARHAVELHRRTRWVHRADDAPGAAVPLLDERVDELSPGPLTPDGDAERGSGARDAVELAPPAPADWGCDDGHDGLPGRDLDDLAGVATRMRSTRGHVAEAHAERVHPEVVGQLGVARRDVPGDTLGEAEAAEESAARRPASACGAGAPPPTRGERRWDGVSETRAAPPGSCPRVRSRAKGLRASP